MSDIYVFDHYQSRTALKVKPDTSGDALFIAAHGGYQMAIYVPREDVERLRDFLDEHLRQSQPAKP